MAAVLAEPTLSLSASIVRAPLSTSQAPSMADTLPALNFGFEDLRARMDSFTQKFDEFIERGRRRVLEERNHFRMRLAEVEESQSQKLRDIAALSSESSEYASALDSQQRETAEIQETIASLSSTRDAHASNVAALKQRLASTQKNIKVRKDAQREHAQYLAHQQSFDQPELEFWEGYLGLRIEGVGVDYKVKFVFTGCDERRPDKTAQFEVDMSEGGYEVTSTRPSLDMEKVQKRVDSMCQTENLAAFLKSIRELFVEAFK